MLVYNDANLAQFRVDHNILDNVLIERPCPNEDVDFVEGEGDHIPVRTWLIHQADLKFPLSPLAEGGYGLVPPHIHASVSKFRLNHSGSGRFDEEREAKIYCCGFASCILHSAA